MKKYNTKNRFFIILLSILVVSCLKSNEKTSRVDRLPYYENANFTPNWLNDSQVKTKDFHKIPPFRLTNQDGIIVSEKTVKDKIYVVDFFFTTCPGICPKMSDNMAIVQDAFKEDSKVLLLSHSVTPKIDSVPILKQYAIDRNIISNKWHLLTGEKKQIYDLGRKAYFVEEDLGEEKSVDDFLHTENFVLIDTNRHIRGIYNGLNKASVQQLIVDVMTLKNEN